jgi:L-asparaginase
MNKNTKLPTVVILALGGTIECLSHSRTDEHYEIADFGIKGLVENVPELYQIANIEYRQVTQIFSHDITEKIWLDLAREINSVLQRDDVAGVVVTHGTDTLEETAYFLHLTIKSNKPVVLTGAMKPHNHLVSDGLRNLFCSVLVVVSQEAVGKGVMVVMNDAINGARDVTKANVNNLEGFKSPEIGVLGYVQGMTVAFYSSSSRRHTLNSEFDMSNFNSLPKVHIFYGYIGCCAEALHAVSMTGPQGIVYVGVGKGLMPNNIMPGLIEARKRGMVIVRSTRVSSGIITYNQDLDGKHDFIAGNNLNPQKARILLSLGLTKTSDTKEIQKMFDVY